MQNDSFPGYVRGLVTVRTTTGRVAHYYTARMYSRPVLAFSAAHRLARFLAVPIRPLTLAVVDADAIEGLVYS